MTFSRKVRIAQAITKVLNWNYNLPPETIQKRIKMNPLFLDKLMYIVPSESHLNDPSTEKLDELKEELQAADVYLQNLFRHRHVCIVPNQSEFVKETLEHNMNDAFSYRKPEKVIVEFSSPNIAKPFHFGHLRSTVIGNFIANINKFFHNEVIRMNYLGDWGVQFGLMKYGLKDGNYKAEDIVKNPIKLLHQAYVAANTKAEESPEIFDHAKQIFCDLEFADKDSPDIREWHTFRQYSMQELVRVYQRLGIEYDEYCWESDYSAQNIRPLIEKMKHDGILTEEEDNCLMITTEGITVPFIKQDGTSLYLSRDTAAALDRYERYKFDKMFYVVDIAQLGHFALLKNILQFLNPECAAKSVHIPFGRVMGMSTRKGDVVWLDDIIDELRNRMTQKQQETTTTKVTPGGEIAETLGISALIVNDLKQKRRKSYEFSWDSALKIDGYSGGKLQYTHCRLVSLEEKCDATLPTECDPSVFKQLDLLHLINTIARFEDILVESYESCEACILVTYLFDLCDCVNRIFPDVKVKGMDPHIASQRLLLYMKTKEILNISMKIIGLKPLDRM